MEEGEAKERHKRFPAGCCYSPKIPWEDRKEGKWTEEGEEERKKERKGCRCRRYRRKKKGRGYGSE